MHSIAWQLTKKNELTRNLAIANRSRVSSAHKVTTVNLQRTRLSWGGSIWNTGGGGYCRKHKFYGEIVFAERKHNQTLLADACYQVSDNAC